MTWCAPLSFSKNCPVMRIPSSGPVGRTPELFETHLFDVKKDPEQTSSLNDTVIEKQMIEKMLQVMVQNDAPVEQYERLGLDAPGAPTAG